MWNLPTEVEVAIQELIANKRHTSWVDFADNTCMVHWYAVVGTPESMVGVFTSPLANFLTLECIKTPCSVCNRDFKPDEELVLRLGIADEVYYSLSRLKDDHDLTNQEALRELVRRKDFANYPTWEFSVVHRGFCESLRGLRNIL